MWEDIRGEVCVEKNIEKGFSNTLNIQTIIRTSAILWSDELGITKTDTIKRKLIESVFVINNNKEISLEELILKIQESYKLIFTEEEVLKIINSADDSFECNSMRKSLCLIKKRYEKLTEKDDTFGKVVCNFCTVFTQYRDEDVFHLIERYLYELLNTNIKAYLYVLKPNKCSLASVVIDNKKFSEKEVQLLNDFITWDNKEKNLLIFKLVSFSIEYSLVSNNSDKNIYYQSLKTKVFYLDSNILYRALGINGEFRRQRTQYFLSKCRQAGQTFTISLYTKNEIEKSIDAHIKELSKLSYGRINPEIFKDSGCNSGFYEYYHKWRKDRASKSLEVFRAYLLTEIDNLCSKFGILVDYRNQIKETNSKIDRVLTQYIKELKEIKKEPNELIVRTDALNMLVLENRRGNNNISLQDTKYYLLTTDQKLQQWDTMHGNNQPLTLLPSHWMGLLLKFISRTEDDFSSFTSFLKLPSNQSILTPEELENVVTGISEMTEDFQMQSSIMKKMVETKFEAVLKNKKSSSIRENVIAFSKSFLEDVYTHEISVRDQTIENNSIEFYQKLEEKEKEVNLAKLEALKFRYETVKTKLNILDEKIKNIRNKTNKIRTKRVFLSIFYFILYFVLLICLVMKFTWNTMEPIIYFISSFYFGLSYLYIFKKGQSFNPIDYFDNGKIEEILLKKANLDKNEYNDLLTEKKDCEELLAKFQDRKNAL